MEKNKSKIVASVHCFNTPKELMDNCIKSVKEAIEETHSDRIKLIIFDDASTNYTSKYPADIVFKENSDGVFRTKLRIVKELYKMGYTDNDFVTFIDSDDIVSKDFFTGLLAKMDEVKADIYSSEVFESIKVDDKDPVIRIWRNITDKRLMPGRVRYHNGKVLRLGLFENAMKEFDTHHLFYGEESLHFCYAYPLINKVARFDGIYHYINRIKTDAEGTEYRHNEEKYKKYREDLRKALEYCFEKYPEIRPVFTEGTDFKGVSKLKVLTLFNINQRQLNSLLAKIKDTNIVIFIFNDTMEFVSVPLNFESQVFINFAGTGSKFVEERIKRYGRFRGTKNIEILTIDDILKEEKEEKNEK